MTKIYFFYIVALVLYLSSCKVDLVETELRVARFDEIRVDGELKERIHRNFNRMEEEKYLPQNVFLTNEESGWWPGDTEGRTILALVLNSQATGREPKYLDAILARFPEKVNADGYFGDIHPASLVDEQQLSSHGWVFRALCEYHLWKNDARSLSYLNTMLDNLALRTQGFHKNYPIEPLERSFDGKVIGTRIEKSLNGWILSTDIGCVFVFLDGLIQAYEITGREDLRPIIDEIVTLYKRIDVDAIKAQTHSTLTGLRAILRYYGITKDESLLQIAKERYKAYTGMAMTENYENYNWFGRPTWTEPCAVIDSYMSAVQLWQYTGNPVYLSDAQKIYYNGICFEQRANGGFGLSYCSGAQGHTGVMVNTNEASHCCSMRGGEGLSRVAQYTAFIKGNQIYLTNLVAGDYALQLNNGQARFAVVTDYPFANRAKLSFTDDAKNLKLSFFCPMWLMDVQVLLNGKEMITSEENGFVVVAGTFKKGDILDIVFEQKAFAIDAENPNSMQGLHKYMFGPLLLGVRDGEIDILSKDAIIKRNGRQSFTVGEQPMTTVYHFMEPEVKAFPSPRYMIQILFRHEN